MLRRRLVECEDCSSGIREVHKVPNLVTSDGFDPMLLGMAQQCQGIEPLLETFFSFMRRKTDCYAAPVEKVEDIVMKAVKKQHALAQKTQAEKKRAYEAEDKRRKEAEDHKGAGKGGKGKTNCITN